MFPVVISLELFRLELLPLPVPSLRCGHTLEVNRSQTNGLCSCQEIFTRRSSQTVSNYPLTFSIVAYEDEALSKFYTGYGGLAAANGQRPLSKQVQSEVLNQLKMCCQCESEIASGWVTHVPQSKRRSRSPDSAGPSHKRVKSDALPATTSGSDPVCFHHVFRTSPVALYLMMRFDEPSERYRVIDRGICDTINTDVTGHRSGRIYIAQRPSSQKYLKIGVTSAKQAAKRFMEQKQQCFADDFVLLKETTEIPWAQRVEQIVFKELALSRRSIDCGKCGQQHAEWFEVDLKRAETTIKRWANWVLRQPYDSKRKLHKDWSKRVKRRADKARVTSDQKTGETNLLTNPDTNVTEEKLLEGLDQFVAACIDVHNQPPLMEWCSLTQTQGSTRC